MIILKEIILKSDGKDIWFIYCDMTVLMALEFAKDRKGAGGPRVRPRKGKIQRNLLLVPATTVMCKTSVLFSPFALFESGVGDFLVRKCTF